MIRSAHLLLLDGGFGLLDCGGDDILGYASVGVVGLLADPADFVLVFLLPGLLVGLDQAKISKYVYILAT